MKRGPRNESKAGVAALKSLKHMTPPHGTGASVSEREQQVGTAYVSVIEIPFYECGKSSIGTEKTWKGRLKFQLLYVLAHPRRL